MNNRKAVSKPVILAAAAAAVFCCFLSACNQDSAVSSQAEPVGQDEEAVGYYKRVSIAKDGETFEEMKEMLDVMKKGFLVLKEDHTAFFELDGEITEYTFDKQYFYLRDDTEKNNGFPYTYIGGKLIVNDGAAVTQYVRLTDEELAAYQNSKENA